GFLGFGVFFIFRNGVSHPPTNTPTTTTNTTTTTITTTTTTTTPPTPRTTKPTPPPHHPPTPPQPPPTPQPPQPPPPPQIQLIHSSTDGLDHTVRLYALSLSHHGISECIYVYIFTMNGISVSSVPCYVFCRYSYAVHML